MHQSAVVVAAHVEFLPLYLPPALFGLLGRAVDVAVFGVGALSFLSRVGVECSGDAVAVAEPGGVVGDALGVGGHVG